jgi:hypothetical protein
VSRKEGCTAFGTEEGMKNHEKGGKAYAKKCAELKAAGIAPGTQVRQRMRVWRPWINRFGLSYDTIRRHRFVYTLEFGEQLGRCADDDARMLLLQIPTK